MRTQGGLSGVADRTIVFWTGHGYTVRTRSFHPTQPDVSTTSPTGAQLYFDVEEDGLQLDDDLNATRHPHP